MKVLSYDEFVAYFNKYGRFPRGAYSRKRPPNEDELKHRYERYLRSEGRSEDYRSDKQRTEEVTPEGSRRCVLLNIVSNSDDEEILRHNAGHLLFILDRAHVFNKSSYPWMRYLSDNVVWLNRFSHTCLDTQCDPITGRSTTPEMISSWWQLLVGDERYERLIKLSNTPS